MDERDRVREVMSHLFRLRLGPEIDLVLHGVVFERLTNVGLWASRSPEIVCGNVQGRLPLFSHSCQNLGVLVQQVAPDD